MLQLLFCGENSNIFITIAIIAHDAVLCWFPPTHRAAKCTTNAPVLSFLALKLLLSLDRTGHPRRPRNQPHLLAKSYNPQPLFPLLLCLQLLHRDTASPRKFPPWPLTLLILAQALPPQLSSQDVPHLPKLSEPTPFADGVHEFPQPGPSQSIPRSPPPGFPVHSAQAVPAPTSAARSSPSPPANPSPRPSGQQFPSPVPSSPTPRHLAPVRAPRPTRRSRLHHAALPRPVGGRAR